MEITFKKITEARQYLQECGYRFDEISPLSGAEIYVAGPLTAFLRKVPFKGVRITIR